MYFLSTLVTHLLSFFFNATATTEIYTLSLHDALPISFFRWRALCCEYTPRTIACHCEREGNRDRKSTRLNSSHQIISYAVFCLKKKMGGILALTLGDTNCTIPQRKHVSVWLTVWVGGG